MQTKTITPATRPEGMNPMGDRAFTINRNLLPPGGVLPTAEGTGGLPRTAGRLRTGTTKGKVIA